MGGKNSLYNKGIQLETFGALNPSGHGGWLQGGGGGNGNPYAMDPNAQLMEFLSQQQTQQQQALAQQSAAQARALKVAQQEQARQEALQGTQLSEQEIQTRGLLNAAKDQPNLAAYQNAMQQAGASQTGSPININAMNQAATANLGQASGKLPGTAYNQAGNITPPVNPALQGSIGTLSNPLAAPKNQFSMPSMSNLQFGSKI
jgi:hypothetical protein